LVGAPFAFIRGPSVAEGSLLGGVGAALSIVLLWAMFVAVRGRLYEAVAGFADIGELRFLGWQDSLLLVLAGFAVGALAGVVAARSVR
jgi:cell division protein FtsX